MLKKARVKFQPLKYSSGNNYSHFSKPFLTRDVNKDTLCLCFIYIHCTNRYIAKFESNLTEH